MFHDFNVRLPSQLVITSYYFFVLWLLRHCWQIHYKCKLHRWTDKLREFMLKSSQACSAVQFINNSDLDLSLFLKFSITILPYLGFIQDQDSISTVIRVASEIQCNIPVLKLWVPHAESSTDYFKSN